MPCILLKKAKPEMISTRLDSSNHIHPCILAKKGKGRGGKGKGLRGMGLEGEGVYTQYINKAEKINYG